MARTGDIGLLFITSETGIAAGVRRIEAVTGIGAIDYARAQFTVLDKAADLVRSNRAEVVSKLVQLTTRIRQLEKEKEQLQSQLATGGGQDLSATAQDIDGVKVLTAQLNGADTKSIRSTIDRLRDKLGDSVVVLASTSEGKTKLFAGVSRSMTGKIHAGKLINELVSQAGGRGGGRADMAEGGIPAEAVDQCLRQVTEKVKHYLDDTA